MTIHVENRERVENALMILATFSRCYHLFYAISSCLEAPGDQTANAFPFRTIANALLVDATISWCKVFGSNSENTHWKTVIPEETIFRNALYENLGIRGPEFLEYWREMTGFRNRIVAHFDNSYIQGGRTPSFEIARKSAYFAHKYILANIPDEAEYVGPRDLEELGRHAVQELSKFMHV